MKDLLDKISSYNLFNYLLPGVIFCVIISKLTHVNLLQEDIVTGAFLYYFIGLVISRFGSLIIEPFLKWIKILKFADYTHYVKASKDDPKLEILSESNNMYRTLTSLFLMVLVSKRYLFLAEKYKWPQGTHWTIILVGLLVMFVFSYRKQTKYISKRIKANLK